MKDEAMIPALASPNRPAAADSPPSVTCVIIAYNHAKYVEEALDSAFAQTYSNLQIIVFDDASTDETAEVIRSHLKETGNEDVLFVAHEKNQGLCATLNEALDLIDTDYVAFIAADDMQDKNRFETQINLMEGGGSSVGFCYSNMRWIDANSQVIADDYFGSFGITDPGSGDMYLPLTEKMSISTASVLIRTATLRRVGYYDESLPAEDYDMFLRLASISKVAYSPAKLVDYRLLTTSLWHQLTATPDILPKVHRRALSKHLAGPAEVSRAAAGRVSGISKDLYLLGESPHITYEYLTQIAPIERSRSTNAYRLLARFRIPGRLVSPAISAARRTRRLILNR